jgi:hypothetical protein
MYGSRRVTGITIVGVRGLPVAVEAHIGRGLPSLTLTGLPGAPAQTPGRQTTRWGSVVRQWSVKGSEATGFNRNHSDRISLLRRCAGS